MPKKKPKSEPKPKKVRTPQQIGRSSRNKGSSWERGVAKLFQLIFEGTLTDEIKRGIGQARWGGEVPDVKGVPGLWPECKHGKQTNPRAALLQALQAIAEAKAHDKFPIAVCKDDLQTPFIAMYLDDFLLLLKEWWARDRRTFIEELLHGERRTGAGQPAHAVDPLPGEGGQRLQAGTRRRVLVTSRNGAPGSNGRGNGKAKPL